MRHKRWSVICKQLHRLRIGQMSLATTNASLQVKRIATIFKEIFIVVRFQKCSVTLPEMIFHIFTR
jgi:hypothetical protein